MVTAEHLGIDERPVLHQLWEKYQAGEYDAIFVYRVDRLSRSPGTFMALRDSAREVRRCRIKGDGFIFVQGSSDPTPEGNLFSNIEYEREVIKLRTITGKKKLAKAGKYAGGSQPLGYRWNDKEEKWEIVEEETKIIKLIYQWYVYGDDSGQPMGMIRIAEKLTELGIPTPNQLRKTRKGRAGKMQAHWGDATYYPEKLYESTNWQDSTTPAEQTAIATILSTDQPNQPPWVTALEYANNIRGVINLNFNDAVGRSQCQNLYVPSNISDSVTSVISNSARCDVYGVPCQGTQPGTYSDCPELGFPAENIASTHTGSFTGTEVFHPQDLTAALTSSNNWYSNYKGKFIKVTNISNGMWIVVRVTDQAPAGTGVELAYRPGSMGTDRKTIR